MNSKIYLILMVCASLTLAACGSSRNNGNDDKADGGGVTPDDPEVTSALAAFGNLSEDDQPLALTDELDEDIQAVFGGADGVSTDVVAGDTVQSVIDRANSN